MSTCKCSFNRKNYNCSHIITLCAKNRVAGCTFDNVALDLKLPKKSKKGRKPKRKGCLVRDINPESTATNIEELAVVNKENFITELVKTTCKKKKTETKDLVIIELKNHNRTCNVI